MIRPSGYDYLLQCGQGEVDETWLVRKHHGIDCFLLRLFWKKKSSLEKNSSIPQTLEDLHTLKKTLKKLSPTGQKALLPILKFGETEDCLFYTMPRPDAAPTTKHLGDTSDYTPITLLTWIQNHCVTAEQVLQLSLQILDCLDARENSGLFPSPITPRNFCFLHEQLILIPDTLLNQRVQTTEATEAKNYLQPEIASPEKTDSYQQGLYLLGKLLYCMDTGNPIEKFSENTPVTEGKMRPISHPLFTYLWRVLITSSPAIRITNTTIVRQCLQDIWVHYQPQYHRGLRWLRFFKIQNLLVYLVLLLAYIFFDLFYLHFPQFQYSSILDAIKDKNIVAVKIQIWKSKLHLAPALTSKEEQGISPLLFTLQQSHPSPEILKFILFHGGFTGQFDLLSAIETAILSHQPPEILDILLNPSTDLKFNSFQEKKTKIIRQIFQQHGGYLLRLAIYQKEQRTCQILLHAGASVTETDRYGNNALHLAMANGLDQVAFTILNHNQPHYPQILTTNQLGLTPLHLLNTKEAKLAEKLLKTGIDANLPAKDGSTPLLRAIRQGCSLQVIQTLLTGISGERQNQAYPNLADNCGNTPISAAIRLNNEPLVNLLWEKGAVLNTQDSLGRTPLHLAVLAKRPQMVRWLLKHQVQVDVKDSLGRTPLHWAALRNDAESVLLLLAAKSSPQTTDNNQMTAAALAAVASANELASLLAIPRNPSASILSFQRLLQKYALLNPHISEEDSQKLAHLMQQKELDMAHILSFLDGAPDLTPRHPNDHDFVRLAIQSHSLPLLLTVLASNPPLDIPDSDSVTPLLYAAKLGELNMTEALCAAGADITHRDATGKDWMEIAADHHHFSVAYLAASCSPQLFLRHSPHSNDAKTLQRIQRKNPGYPSFQELWQKQGLSNMQDFIFQQIKNQNCSALAESLIQGYGTPNLETVPGISLLFSPELNYPILKTLLEQGADPNVVNEQGETVFQCMLRRRAPRSMLRLILEYGAIYASKTHNAKTSAVKKTTLSNDALRFLDFYLGPAPK